MDVKELMDMVDKLEEINKGKYSIVIGFAEPSANCNADCENCEDKSIHGTAVAALAIKGNMPIPAIASFIMGLIAKHPILVPLVLAALASPNAVQVINIDQN